MTGAAVVLRNRPELSRYALSLLSSAKSFACGELKAQSKLSAILSFDVAERGRAFQPGDAP